MELKFSPIYPLPAFLTPLPLMLFTKKEIFGCTNQETEGVNKAPGNHITPSYNSRNFSTDFMI